MRKAVLTLRTRPSEACRIQALQQNLRPFFALPYRPLRATWIVLQIFLSGPSGHSIRKILCQVRFLQPLSEIVPLCHDLAASAWPAALYLPAAKPKNTAG